MKYSEALKTLILALKEQGHEEAELDAWYLMEEISGFSRAAWFIHLEEIMPEDKRLEFFELGERLLAEEPISYIIGSREFMGLSFAVNSSVLIPRQDTELLVEKAISEVKIFFDSKRNFVSVLENCEETIGRSKSAYRILDLCTGSGCIAISVYKFLKEMGVPVIIDASDISDKALEMAKKNAIENKADINFIKSNMFEQISGKYDMIISNPPYIPEKQLFELDKKVLDYEPRNALYGGKDGLDFYRIIASQAVNYLEQGGRLMLEIGFDQGNTVPELLAKNGFKKIEMFKDYNRLDRVVKAVL